MDKGRWVVGPQLVGKWGPLPPSYVPPYSEAELERARPVWELLRLRHDICYYLFGDEVVGGAPIKSRADFDRAQAQLHRNVELALAGRGDPSFLQFLANQTASSIEKILPPLPRGATTMFEIEGCFTALWLLGKNWLTRMEFFEMCRTELAAQGYSIGYRHFVRLLKKLKLDKYFPPMRKRRKRSGAQKKGLSRKSPKRCLHLSRVHDSARGDAPDSGG
jgi:hypothetical protein